MTISQTLNQSRPQPQNSSSRTSGNPSGGYGAPRHVSYGVPQQVGYGFPQQVEYGRPPPGAPINPAWSHGGYGGGPSSSQQYGSLPHDRQSGGRGESRGGGRGARGARGRGRGGGTRWRKDRDKEKEEKEEIENQATKRGATASWPSLPSGVPEDFFDNVPATEPKGADAHLAIITRAGDRSELPDVNIDGASKDEDEDLSSVESEPVSDDNAGERADELSDREDDKSPDTKRNDRSNAAPEKKKDNRPPPGWQNVALSQHNSQVTVLTNHLAVKQVPHKIYQYKIGLIKTDIPQGFASRDNRSYHPVKAKAEKKRVFEALVAAGRYGLNQRTDWATDYNHLWTLKPLHRKKFGNRKQPFTYSKQNGVVVSVRQFPLRRTKDSPLRILPIATDLVVEPSNENAYQKVQALNAFVSKKILSFSNPNMFSGGANNFYLRYRHEYKDHLQLVRGYYNRIKPGSKQILLNVNTTASAFFHAPMLVSEFITFMQGPDNGCDIDYIAHILRNKQVWVLVDLSRDPNNRHIHRPNDHKERKITDFGVIPEVQDYWDVQRQQPAFDYQTNFESKTRRDYVPRTRRHLLTTPQPHTVYR